MKMILSPTGCSGGATVWSAWPTTCTCYRLRGGSICRNEMKPESL